MTTLSKRGAQLDATARAALAETDPDRRQALRGLVVEQAAGLCKTHVCRTIRQYGRRLRPYEPDLMQEASLGVLRALDKFDVDRGTAFATVALLWIRAAVSAAIPYYLTPVRVPAYLFHSGAATCSEDGEYREARDRAMNASVTSDPFTLSQMTGPEEPDLIEREHRRHQCHQLLKQLDARSRAVVVQRMGLDNSDPLLYREIAANLRLSRRRIDQLWLSALAKLRRCPQPMED